MIFAPDLAVDKQLVSHSCELVREAVALLRSSDHLVSGQRLPMSWNGSGASANVTTARALAAHPRSQNMPEGKPGGHDQAQDDRGVRQPDAQGGILCQLIIIHTMAAIITRNPVIAVATKACSMRSIAIAAPFSSRPSLAAAKAPRIRLCESAITLSRHSRDGYNVSERLPHCSATTSPCPARPSCDAASPASRSA
jgi:hypothetical protein